MSDSVKYIKYNGGIEASAFKKTGGSANDILIADGTTLDTSNFCTAELAVSLQQQIDGEISSWFFEGEPTTSNVPANDWTTEELKQRHEGDTYTDITTFVDNTTTPTAGQSWRWCKGNTTGDNVGWHWHKIADSDAVKALQDAAKAQQLANAAQSTADVAKTTANTAQSIANEVREDFDNLEIGGRNLLRYTDQSNYSSKFIGWLGTLSLSNGWIKVTQNSGVSSVGIITPKESDGATIENGHSYILSFDCYLDTSALEDSINANYCYLMFSSGGNYIIGNYAIINKTPRRVSIPFTFSSNRTEKFGAMIGCQGTNIPAFYIKDIKLEQGDKATAWTPAPEDKLDKITGTDLSILYIGTNGVTSSTSLKYDAAGTLMTPKINITRTNDWTNNELKPLTTQSVVIGQIASGNNNLLFTRAAIQAGVGTNTSGTYTANTLYLNPQGGAVQVDGTVNITASHPHITGPSEVLTLGGKTGDLTKGSGVFDYTNNCFRRNSSSAGMTLGLSTIKWANVYTDKINGFTILKSVPANAVFTDTNYYPTAFSWTPGTTAGPTGTLSGNGMSAVSINAIPAATDSQSGVVTTGNQTFAGTKTFAANILPSTSAPAIGTTTAIEPGLPKPTYISLGSDDKYFDTIYARKFKGLVDNALKLYTYDHGNGVVYVMPLAVNKGSESKPVYFKDGVPVECSFLSTSYVLKAGDTMTGSLSAPAFYETSDIRKKEIKSDLSLDKCYDLIDKCQTVIYSLKDLTKEQVGMIAQEIEEFFPEVINTDEEGFKSLAYDRLVVICFKVLKDIIKRLEKLEL